MNSHPSEALNWNDVLTQLSVMGFRGDMPVGPTWLGDSCESSTELVGLVLSGRKRATTSLLAEWEFDNEPVIQPGTVEVLLHWDNSIACVIETTEVDILPFADVSEAFAYREGEGDRTLRYWQEVHEVFFQNVCQRIGVKFNWNMLVVCESFVVKHRFEHA